MRGRGLAMMAGARMGQERARQQYEQQAAMQQKDYEVQQAQQQAQQAQQAAAAPSANVTDELKRLADLHASGVLSDDEFAAAKKKLLGL